MISINHGNQFFLKDFYGYDPIPFPYVSIVVFLDDNIVAIAGFVKKNIGLEEDSTVMFSDIKQILRVQKEFKRVVVIVSGLLIQRVEQSLNVFAVAQGSIGGSDLLLKHMGFNNIDGDLWVL